MTTLFLWLHAFLAAVLPLIHTLQLVRAWDLEHGHWHIPPNLVSRSRITETTTLHLCIALLALSGVLLLDHIIQLVVAWSCTDRRYRWTSVRQEEEEAQDSSDEEEDQGDSDEEENKRKESKAAIPMTSHTDDGEEKKEEDSNHPLLFDFNTDCWMLRLLHWRYHVSVELIILLVLVVLELIVMVHPDIIMLMMGSLSIAVCLLLGMMLAWRRFRYAHRLASQAQNSVQLEAAAAVSTWALPHPPIPHHIWNPHMDAQAPQNQSENPTTKPKSNPKASAQLRIRDKWVWFIHYQHMWTWPIYVIMAISTLLLFIFFVHTCGQSRPFYSFEQRRDMEQHDTTFEDWRKEQIQNQTQRLPTVVLVVLDGMRYDVVLDHPDWIALRTNTSYPWTSDLVFLESQAAIPTVSLPNWATLASGTRPEITGMKGNAFISQIPADHLFARAARFDLPVFTGDLDIDDTPAFSDWNPQTIFDSVYTNSSTRPVERTLIGSPMYVQILEAALPPRTGQGAVPEISRSARVDANTESVGFFGIYNWLAGMAQAFNPILNYVTDVNVPSDPVNKRTLEPIIEADLIRAQDISVALTQPYKLSFVHLESADHMAHQYGVHHHKYHRACSEYARAVRRILVIAEHRSAVDPNDTVIVAITTDHGHVSKGGHGGLGPEIRRTPLLLYARNLTTQIHNLTVDATKQHHITAVDVSTSLALVLGIPVPRQSTGRWIEALMPLVDENLRERLFADLYEQRRILTWYFMIQSGLPRDDMSFAHDHHASLISFPVFAASIASLNLSTVDTYALALYELHDQYELARESVMKTLLIRNFVVASMIATTVLLFVWWRFHVFGEFQFLDTPLRIEIHRYWLYALGVVILYEAFVIGVYIIVFVARGYTRWDSTHIHSDAVMPLFLMTALLPGIGFMFFLVRVLAVPILAQEAVDREFVTAEHAHEPLFILYDWMYKGCQFLTVDFYLWRARTKHSIKQSLRLLNFFSFVMILALVQTLVIFILESILGVLLPLCVPVQMVDSILWEFQFRILSLHIMNLPLQYGSIVGYQVMLHATAMKILQRHGMTRQDKKSTK